jgi:DNA (cytosine-5)-methyltransferase 1
MLTDDIGKISSKFNKSKNKSPFLNSGYFFDNVAYTLNSLPKNPKNRIVLGDVLQNDDQVDEAFWIDSSRIKEWKYHKGAKSIIRTHKESGTTYNYAEGRMAFPDLLQNPSRTILTAEGGSTPSRFKHIIKIGSRYRRLTPIELERLNGFPDNWTKLFPNGDLVPDNRRAFFMGNALVIGIVEKIGRILAIDLKI